MAIILLSAAYNSDIALPNSWFDCTCTEYITLLKVNKQSLLRFYNTIHYFDIIII